MTTFWRSEGEKYLELKEFKHALERGFEDAPIEDGASRYSPGDDIKRFYATKPKKHPTTDTEKAVLLEVSDAPYHIGPYSNVLIYSDRFRYLDLKTKKAIWSLVRGGALKLVRMHSTVAGHRTYWLVANP